MKRLEIENVRQVKARLDRLIAELPKTGSVVITKNGRACAALMPITEDTDLETLALSQNKRIWRMFDAAYERPEKEGWVDLRRPRLTRLQPANCLADRKSYREASTWAR